MKKLIEAYNQGRDGEKPTHGGRAARLAHRIGQSSYEAAVRINDEIEAEKRQEFINAWEAATGFNKNLFAIVDDASRIPHQGLTGTRDLIRSYTHKEKGVTEKVWNASFSFGQNENDPNRANRTPLTPGNGTLLVDSTDWAHNGFNSHVDNAHITLRARQDENGSTVGVKSHITINEQPYDPDTIELDENHNFTGGISLDIGEDGTVENIGVTSSSQTGYADRNVETSTTSLSEFLPWLQSAVRHTADLYSTSDEQSLLAEKAEHNEQTEVEQFERSTEDRKKAFLSVAPAYIDAVEKSGSSHDETELEYKKLLEAKYGIKLPSFNINNFYAYFLPKNTYKEDENRSVIDEAYDIDNPIVSETYQSVSLLIKLRDDEPELFSLCQDRAVSYSAAKQDNAPYIMNVGHETEITFIATKWELEAALQLAITHLATYTGYSEDDLRDLTR